MCYNYAWAFHELQIKEILGIANERAVTEIKDFVLKPWDSHPDAKIATGLVLPGSNIANHFKLFDRMKHVLRNIPRVYVVSLNSKHFPNLKSAIAWIVKSVTEKYDGNTNTENNSLPSYNDNPSGIDTENQDELNGPLAYDKRLRYDLEILAEWCKALVLRDKSISSLNDIRIVVSIDDAHALDTNILAGLIKQMQSYISQIPFKLILSIAKSIDVFQESVKRSCIRMLEGTSINAHLTGCLEEVILDTVLESTNPKTLLIGPNTFRNIIRRQRESLESIDSFVSALKYTYMTYFYSNPLSIIPTLYKNDKLEYPNKFLTSSHYAAVRLLPSFRVLVENLAETDPSKVRPLLEDDSVLLTYIRKAVHEFNEYKNTILYGIMVLEALQQFTYSGSEAEEKPSNNTQPLHSRIDLYSSALLGEIPTSEWFKYIQLNYAKGGLTALVELLRLTDPDRDADVWPCAISPVPAPFATFYRWVFTEHSDLLLLLLDPDNGNLPRHDAEALLLNDIQMTSKFVSAFRQISESFFNMILQKVFTVEDPGRPKNGILEPQMQTSYGNSSHAQPEIDSNVKPEESTSESPIFASSEFSSSTVVASSGFPKPKGSGGVGVGHWYKSYFLNELFVIDNPALQENVFVPTYRAAIDMALSNPKHYWGDIGHIAAKERQKAAFEEYLEKKQGHERAKPKDPVAEQDKVIKSEKESLDHPYDENHVRMVSALAATAIATDSSTKNSNEQPVVSENEWSASALAYEPHLSIIYTLYRESALYINIYDYYSAFMSVIKQPQDEGDPLFERRALAWFLQSVAELKSLGILRDSKRKFECVEKLIWRDL